MQQVVSASGERQASLEDPGHILVVDDEPGILTILRDVLEYDGFRVDTAGDGDTALSYLRDRRYDVVLTDLKMPQMDGLELVRRIREHDQDSKVIIMTGFGTVETAVDAMKKGAFDYILKPFKPDEVMRLLHRAVDRGRIERENLVLRETIGFYELSEALSSAMPLDQQLALISERAQTNLGAVGVVIVTEDVVRPGKFVTRMIAGPPTLSVRAEPVLQKLLVDERLIAHGAGCQPFLASEGDAVRVQSFVAAPLKVRGVPIGFIAAWTHNAGLKFTEGQRKGLAVLAGRAANAIDLAKVYADLKGSFTQTIEGLARALEAMDPYTAGHSDRVAYYAQLMARTMGMPEPAVERVFHGGLLHDIGKIGINLNVLNKPQKLSEAEYEMFKSHTVKGRHIVEPISFLAHLVPFIYQHHEQFNGRGYPEQLGSLDISADGRLMAVADCYDAMTSNRPYRKALPHEIAVAELHRCSGKQFDRDMVKVFTESIDNDRRERTARGLAIPE